MDQSDNALHIGTCAVLINPQGQVLMGKRKNSYQAGSYGLPGGRLELNEPLTNAIAREVFEETGMSIQNLEYLGVVRDNQGDYEFIHFVFGARNVSQTPQLCEPDKCEDWEWLDTRSKIEPILRGHKAAIEMYLSKKTLVDLTK